MSEITINNIITVIACDIERAPLDGRSRLLENFHGRPVLHHTLGAACAVPGVAAVTLLCPEDQTPRLRQAVAGIAWPKPVDVLAAPARAPRHKNIAIARAWNMHSWRGGAGDWTVFDEDYHPQGVRMAAAAHRAAHVLLLPGHAALADAQLLEHLLEHHLLKNHSFQLSFLPAVPGLAALVMRAALVEQLAAADWLPGRVMAYRPDAPAFDMLGQDASATVDASVARLRRRLLLDTDRAWTLAAGIDPAAGHSAMEICRQIAAADNAEAFAYPRELQIELTAQRRTHPPGDISTEARAARQPWGAAKWRQLLSPDKFPDDMLVTFAGDGDPLLASEFPEIAAAARAAGALGIGLQTDLAENVEGVFSAARAGALDVVAVRFYGHDAATYARVAGADLFDTVKRNMERLLDFQQANGGLPIVIPKLLKVRETVGQLEAFFDEWVGRVGWACLDYPTDRAGATPFAGVMDMAPPLRTPCRRVSQQLILGADGCPAPCDQDMFRTLGAGDAQRADSNEPPGVEVIWRGPALRQLRLLHREHRWDEQAVCANCREWRRA